MTMLKVTTMAATSAWIGALSDAQAYIILLCLSALALLICAAAISLGPILRSNLQDQQDVNDPVQTTSPLIDGKRVTARDGLAVPARHVSKISLAAAEQRSLVPPPGGVGTFDYQQIVEYIEQIVFMLNPEGELVFLSAPWERLLDYSVADCLSHPISAYIHPEDRPSVDAQLSGVLRGRRDRCQMEVRMIARNETSHWFELRAHGVRDGVGIAIGTLTDIDDQKQVEASLRAVRRSLSTLLNSIPGMVYRCKANRNWSFEFASDGCLEVTGYEPYHLINDPNFYFQNIVFPEDRDYAWNHAHQQVMLQRNFQLVYRIINRPGHVRWVWEQGRGVYSSGGELLALEGFITVVADDGPHAKAVLEKFYELINDDPAIAERLS